MKKLKVDMPELISAFENASPELNHYLDKETGEVVLVSDEVRMDLDEFLEGETEEGVDESAAFEAWLEEFHGPDWMKDSLREAYQVEMGMDTRFVQIPQAESRDGYRDMESFAETVTDKRLQDLLSVALNGRGAFRRFKDVLHDFPEERERWFKFQEEQIRERVMEWLEDEGIEPTF